VRRTDRAEAGTGRVIDRHSLGIAPRAHGSFGRPAAHNGLELSCPAEAGTLPPIVAHAGGPGAPTYAPARRVSFSELLGGTGIAHVGGVGSQLGTVVSRNQARSQSVDKSRDCAHGCPAGGDRGIETQMERSGDWDRE
jgi:hypothetical protein